jgi:SAM-dependent methyltransferase
MVFGTTEFVPLLLEDRVAGHVHGYPATTEKATRTIYTALTQDYAASQQRDNVARTLTFLTPILRNLGARRVLDAGCGVGTMVNTLLEAGFDAQGFDLNENVSHWVEQGLPTDRFVVTDPDRLVLPYADGSFDAAFSFGVIEHVGTTDGNATRRPDYHAVRKQWTQELFRTIRPGGHLLLAGPNKGFPVDTAHALDAAASPVEHWLSRLARVSIHRTWGENFLWSYADVERYLKGVPHTVTALSVEGMAHFSRVPGPVRAVARGYVAHLPRRLLKTGFNPWVMALIRRDA